MLDDLKGGDAKTNASIIRDLLSGKDEGPHRDLLLYNTAVGLVLADKAKDLSQGIQQAKEILISGAGLAKLEAFRTFSQGK